MGGDAGRRVRGGADDGNYVIRVFDGPDTIDAKAWDALVAAQPSATPFVSLAYLRALHDSASAVAQTGWLPRFLGLEEGGRLVAACPLYLKDHSYGEYVFDWAWADAYRRSGLDYYPKLLDAVPVHAGARAAAAGPQSGRARRAAARHGAARARGGALVGASAVPRRRRPCRRPARPAGRCARRSSSTGSTATRAPYADFADFLAGLQRDKRKKIQQERRRVAEAGIAFTAQAGAEIGAADWDYFYRCYARTYREHHSTPYLTRDFFARMAATMARHWLLFTAWRGGRRIAASLIAIDPERRVAFGRYWGATETVSCLHFEACYYQPLAWCIEQGYQRFEGGAQGEHKMARGLLPVQTWSAHWLAHPQFARAVDEFLEREGAGVALYLDELNERLPFKRPAAEPSRSAPTSRQRAPARSWRCRSRISSRAASGPSQPGVFTHLPGSRSL